MPISDELKERILRESDIVDIIGDYVDLKRRGSNFLGLCPFHNEKTPSFTVSQEKNIFKCFGCGKAGNAAGFLMDYAGLSFPEALKELAKKSGIPFEEETLTPEKKEQLTRRDLVLEALRKTAGYYSKLLMTPSGKNILSYYRRRGFNEATIKEFQLGCAPDSWEEIKNRFGKDFNEDILFEAGLIVKNEDKNSTYDRFRKRAIFPIQDAMGKVIAFGARALDDNDGAKYINSPQSIVYDKSNSLYGFYQAKNEIRTKGYAILTEGYADVISLHQAGFKTAVASSGTSLTNEQLLILKRICKRLFFVYDSDFAGLNAAKRGLEMALEQGYEVSIVILPTGEDPDSIIRNNGEKLFKKYLDEAMQFVDFIYLFYKNNGKLDTPLGKTEAIRETIKLISKIADRLQHDFYINKISELYKLSGDQLKEIYKEKVIREKQAKAKTIKTFTKDNQTNITTKNIEQIQARAGSNLSEILPEERYVFELIMSDPGSLDIFKQKYYLSAEIFTSSKAKELFLKLDTMHEDGLDLAVDIFTCEDIKEDERDFLSGFCIGRETPSELWKKFTDGDELIKNDESMYRYVILKPLLKNIESRINTIKNDLQGMPYELQSNNLAELKRLMNKKEEINKIFLELKKL